MKPQYTQFNGKHPAKSKEKRCYFPTPPLTGDYGASYSDDFFKLDVDNYKKVNGKYTDELEEPIQGQPRSEAITKLLNDLGIKYNGITTEHGRHFFFRTPEALKGSRNKQNYYCPIGVKAEWKFPTSDDHIPLKVGGLKRQFFKGSIDNEDIDELPFFLWPMQREKSKPFELEFPEGNRTQHLGGYLFYLVERKEYTPEQAFNIVRYMNEYVFDSPIDEEKLNAEVLNESTMEKLLAGEQDKGKKTLSVAAFQKFLSENRISIKYNELLNIIEYDNLPGRYRVISDLQNCCPTEMTDHYQEWSGLKNLQEYKIVSQIRLEADKNSYNPVKRYLQEIIWDGKDRFPQIFEILGVQNEFNQSLVRKWFYQTAALPFNCLENPIQAEGVLILYGPEGIEKTRFFKLITPNPLWFQSLDKEMSTKNKDVVIQMLGSWISEIGEIDRTFKANKSDIKNFMTLEKDTIRKPYAREPVTKARTTSFCGTSNEGEFLTKDSGYRRWWTISVTKRIKMGNFVEPDNLHQFWAQCYAAFVENSQCFRLTDEERQQLEEQNKDVTEMLPAEEELRLRFDFDASLEQWQWVHPSALVNTNPAYDVCKYTPKQVGAALTKIMKDVPEMKKSRDKHGVVYLIPPAIGYTDINRNKV